MPKKNRRGFPHLHGEPDRQGKIMWYVRIGHGPRIRIREIFGTPEFLAAYQAAITGNYKPASVKAGKLVCGECKPGTLSWLIAAYRETSADWKALKHSTHRNRDNHFKKMIATAGHQPFRSIKAPDIVSGRDRRAATPAQARNYLDAVRGLFGWALSAGHITADPTASVKNFKRKKSRGFPPWTEADAEAYIKKWPIGTRQRVWFDTLCFIGARRGDAVIVGKQHIRDGYLTWNTEKGGELIEVSIPYLPVLKRTIDAGPTGDLAFICGAKGGPFVKESFGNAFSEAARQAGVKKSAHGVRKIAAIRAAMGGATVNQLMAIFGWTSPAMAMLYTKEAERRKMGRSAGHLLESGAANGLEPEGGNEAATSIPLHSDPVREKSKITQ